MQFGIFVPRSCQVQIGIPVTRFLYTLMFLALCGSANAQSTNFVLTYPTNGVDAEKTLGCKSGINPKFSSGNNATRLTAALASKSLKYPPTIPGGDWEIPRRFVFPHPGVRRSSAWGELPATSARHTTRRPSAAVKRRA